MAKVELRDVSLTYHTIEGEILALDRLNVVIRQREFVSIVGPSGCGKSTLLSLVSGLISPTKGVVSVDGKRVLGPHHKVGYMLQQDYLFEWRTILDNALLGLEVRGQRTPDKVERVREMLARYGLGAFERNYPPQLSGGMRQRVALVRTLSVEPDVLLLDEPFSALDYQTRLTVGEEVAGILREQNKTVIMVTHDIPEAISMAHRVLVMTARPGRIRSERAIDIHLDQDIGPLASRQSPRFREYFSAIWKELNARDQPS